MTDHPPKTPASARSMPQLVRERRWWLLPLALWGGVVALSLELQIDKIREQSVQVAVEGARNMFRMVMLTRNWNASHGGVYVPVTPATPPNPYLEHPQRDLMTTDGMALTMINPAYMTRLIDTTARSSAIARSISSSPHRRTAAPTTTCTTTCAATRGWASTRPRWSATNWARGAT